MAALGVLEERFGFSCTSFRGFGIDESMFFAVYDGCVSFIYIILLRKSILDPPSKRFIFVPLLRFLNENYAFGVLAISHEKSNLLVPVNAKSTL